MNQIIMGALAMAFGVAGLFFLRFWKETHDRLFAFFALSFFVMAANRVLLASAVHDGHTGYFYWVRLLAFGLILIAILDKNRSRKSPGA